MAGGWGGARPNSGPKRRKTSPANQLIMAKARARAPASASPVPAESRPPSLEAIAAIVQASKDHARTQKRTAEFNPFKLPDFPPQAMPPESMRMAMDSAPALSWASTQWAGGYLDTVAAEGLIFPGYAFLSELAQRPEYRTFAEIISTESTRKWIKFSTTGRDAEAKRKADKESGRQDVIGAADEDPEPDDSDKADNEKTEKIKELEDFLNDLKVRDRFAELSMQDSFFGRTHLSLDFGDGMSDDELKTPIADANGKFLEGKIAKGSLKRLQVIEPVWTYPTTYNATNPLAIDWYNPQVWYVMGKQIHRSRLPCFVSRVVPDLLKPSYSFGGLSLTQIAKPYVDIWLTTRQSIGDLIHSFSVMVLMTDLATMVQPGAAQNLLARVALFNALRDNQGAFVINKATEDFKNVSASLAGLHELQAQAQEHMMSVARIPAVKFTGIQPTGLNACLTGDTLIETDRGDIPIRDVREGEKVMTRKGWAPVERVGCTGYTTELIEIKTARSAIRCTVDHRIWLPSISAFVPAGNVRPGDLLLCRGEIENRSTANQSHIAVGFGGTEGMAITPPLHLTMESFSFIGKFGASIKDLYRKVTTSITSTEIAQTISSIILKYCRPQIMQICMALPRDSLFISGPNISANVDTARRDLSYSNPRELSFAAIGAGSLIAGETESRWQSLGRSAFASCAAFLFRQNGETQNFALGNAQRRARIAPHTRQTTIKKIVKNGFNSPNAETRSAVSSVRRVPAQEFVYDIQVARGFLPEFFANNICVHNSSEGEMRAFYDTIGAYQNRFYKPNLDYTIDVAQITLWGKRDPDIVYEFESLWELTEKEKSEMRKADAETGKIIIDSGVISPEEERKRVAGDPDGLYHDIDPDDVPELKQEEEGGLAIPGSGGALKAILGEGEGGNGESGGEAQTD